MAAKTVKSVQSRIAELEASLRELEQAHRAAREDLSQAQAGQLLDDTQKAITQHKSALSKARRLAVKENKAKLAEMQGRLAPLLKKQADALDRWQEARQLVTVKESELDDAQSDVARNSRIRHSVGLDVLALEREISQFRAYTGV